ncbi:MAG: FCD domain-containing protein [Pseudomonadales bacterium]|nr:FCD domain-containing protein [Pseudomonadales bacterium]NRA15108.1 FCD domain-containing protein [Oceanospirillaceae bacterium]
MIDTADNESSTIVELLASQVRRDITFGVLLPGAELNLSTLTHQYGGSAKFLQQALILLSGESLVEVSSQSGFRVASTKSTSINNLEQVRVEIECIGLEWSLKNGNIHWQGSVLKAQQALLKAFTQVQLDPKNFFLDWEEGNRQFHHSLLAACDSPRLIAMQDRLFKQGSPLRLADLQEKRIDFQLSIKSLNALVDAILQHDIERAKPYLKKLIRCEGKITDNL